MSATGNEKVAKATTTTIPEVETTTAPLLAHAVAYGRADDDEEVGGDEKLWAVPGEKFKVLAPTDLYAGYQFVVDVDNESFLVEVSTAVNAGTLFEPIVVQQVDRDSYASAVPVGEWRNGLWHS